MLDDELRYMVPIKCEQHLVAKGDYTEPKTLQDSLVANKPLELLCIDFTKADVTKGGKENILILTSLSIVRHL